MNATLTFQAPLVIFIGVPVVAVLLLLAARSQRRRGLSWLGTATIAGLRLPALLVLLLLLAKPTETTRSAGPLSNRPIAILLDRSQSMGLREQDTTRFESARAFLQRQLLPELDAAKLKTRLFVFDQTAEPFDPAKLGSAKPNGSRTDLGSAIAKVATAMPEPPLAIVALTDGAANRHAEDAQASAQLAQAKVPFLGLGFGSDTGARSISLGQLEAPASVSTNAPFTVSARLELTGNSTPTPAQLLLFRDGRLVSRKTAQPPKDCRSWLEAFETRENTLGTYTYSLQLIPPDSPNIYCPNTSASTTVRATDEAGFRVLYVQGALTWDYKFIYLALRGDSALKLTGISRTSQQSIFRQNVDSVAEVQPGANSTNAFPQTLAELSPYRLIVLSNLRPELLSATQQDVLARFCGDLGGGVLLLGGPATFDTSWQGSRLEGLLPVTFAAPSSSVPNGKPFRLQLTPQALQNPIFNIVDKIPPAQAWSKLPPFSDFGRVDALKPGAESWAIHPSEQGPHGNRILMAGQRYGAGLSAVICIQNFWRWRLAPDSDPAAFDRFWRRLFRYLADATRPAVTIHFPNQDLEPQSDIQTVIELLPDPVFTNKAIRQFTASFRNRQNQTLSEQKINLQPLRPVQFSFRPGKSGLYTISVSDSSKRTLASRSLELRDPNFELQHLARNMDSLRQWASITDGGAAFKFEDFTDARALVKRIRAQVNELSPKLRVSRPLGINSWTLSLITALLCAEWFMRKRFGLI